MTLSPVQSVGIGLWWLSQRCKEEVIIYERTKEKTRRIGFL